MIVRKAMQAVFIDIDNTLLDFEEYVKQSMKTGFEHFGLKPYKPYMYDIFTTENNKLWRMIEKGTITFHQLEQIRWNNIFHSLGIEFDGETFEKYFRHALNESAIPVAGAYELLEYLHGKYILCAASNGPYDQQLHRLELAGMKKFFSYFFISEQIGASKPSEEFFARSFEILNDGREKPIMPGETIIIGDSMSSDMAGGKAFGMKTCYFSNGKAAADNIGVDHIVGRLETVEDFL